MLLKSGNFHVALTPLIEISAKEAKEVTLTQAKEIRGTKVAFGAQELTKDVRGKIIGIVEIKPKAGAESKIFIDLPTTGGPNQLRNALKKNVRKLAQYHKEKLKEANINFSIVGDKKVLAKIFARKPKKPLTLQKLPQQAKQQIEVKNEIIEKLNIAKAAQKRGDSQTASYMISLAINRAMELTTEFIQNKKGIVKGSTVATMMIAAVWDTINNGIEEISEDVTDPAIMEKLDNLLSAVEDASDASHQAVYAKKESEQQAAIAGIATTAQRANIAAKDLAQRAKEITETKTLKAISTETESEPETSKKISVEAGIQTPAMILPAPSSQQRIIYLPSPDQQKKGITKKKKRSRRRLKRRKKSKKIGRKRKRKMAGKSIVRAK